MVIKKDIQHWIYYSRLLILDGEKYYFISEKLRTAILKGSEHEKQEKQKVKK